MARSTKKATTPPSAGVAIFKSYESVKQLATELRDAKQCKVWEEDSLFERGEDFQRSWCGETLRDAFSLLDTGDAKRAAKIKAQGEILAENTTGKMPQIVTSVQGCIPNVPNYLRGVPNNMMRVIKEPRLKPIIDLYVDSTIYDGISVDEVARKAAIIANVITATELEGVRVNLYATCGVQDTYRDNKCYGICVKIKDADSPLNLLNVAFSICNRAFCRAIFCRWMECNISSHRMEGYGRPMKGEAVKNEFKLDGLLLSIRDLVDKHAGLEDVTKMMNEYLARCK